MTIRDNRDSVIANIVQQVSAALVFLIVPVLLGVEQYAQVIVVTTLISFLTFSDLGVSYVYTRRMPEIYGRENREEESKWNTTVIRFRIYAALVFAVVIAGIYWIRYHDATNALFLMFYPPLATAVAFYSANNIVQGNFRIVRDVAIVQALARPIMMIPGVVIFGLRGWFAAQLAAILVVFCRADLRAGTRLHWLAREIFDRNLIHSVLPEAVSLGLISVLWVQLLSFGRTFAAFSYPDQVIAQYGLANAGCQMVGLVVIAAFIPQTVKVNRMLATNQAGAVDYVFKTLRRTFPVIIGLTVVALLAAPPLFHIFFQKYHVEHQLLAPLLLSLLYYPVIVSLGVLLSGTGRNSMYLTLLLLGLALSWIAASGLAAQFGYWAAAIAQFLALTGYTAALLAVVSICFRSHTAKMGQVWAYLIVVVMLSGGYLVTLYS